MSEDMKIQVTHENKKKGTDALHTTRTSSERAASQKTREAI